MIAVAVDEVVDALTNWRAVHMTTPKQRADWHAKGDCTCLLDHAKHVADCRRLLVLFPAPTAGWPCAPPVPAECADTNDDSSDDDFEDGDIATLLVSAEVVAAVLRAVAQYPAEPAVLVAALDMLRQLSCLACNMPTMLAAGVPGVVLGVLSACYQNEMVATAACGLLVRLADGSCKQALIAAGALPLLLTTLHAHVATAAVVQPAARALAVLARTGPAVALALVDMRAMQLVLDAGMQTRNSRDLEELARTLCPVQPDAMPPCVTITLAWMADHGGDPAADAAACNALRVLLFCISPKAKAWLAVVRVAATTGVAALSRHNSGAAASGFAALAACKLLHWNLYFDAEFSTVADMHVGIGAPEVLCATLYNVVVSKEEDSSGDAAAGVARWRVDVVRIACEMLTLLARVPNTWCATALPALLTSAVCVSARAFAVAEVPNYWGGVLEDVVRDLVYAVVECARVLPAAATAACVMLHWVVDGAVDDGAVAAPVLAAMHNAAVAVSDMRTTRLAAYDLACDVLQHAQSSSAQWIKLPLMDTLTVALLRAMCTYVQLHPRGAAALGFKGRHFGSQAYRLLPKLLGAAPAVLHHAMVTVSGWPESVPLVAGGNHDACRAAITSACCLVVRHVICACETAPVGCMSGELIAQTALRLMDAPAANNADTAAAACFVTMQLARVFGTQLPDCTAVACVAAVRRLLHQHMAVAKTARRAASALTKQLFFVDAQSRASVLSDVVEVAVTHSCCMETRERLRYGLVGLACATRDGYSLLSKLLSAAVEEWADTAAVQDMAQAMVQTARGYIASTMRGYSKDAAHACTFELGSQWLRGERRAFLAACVALGGDLAFGYPSTTSKRHAATTVESAAQRLVRHMLGDRVRMCTPPVLAADAPADAVPLRLTSEYAGMVAGFLDGGGVFP